MEHEDIMWIEFAKTDLGVANYLDEQYYPKPLCEKYPVWMMNTLL